MCQTGTEQNVENSQKEDESSSKKEIVEANVVSLNVIVSFIIARSTITSEPIIGNNKYFFQVSLEKEIL